MALASSFLIAANDEHGLNPPTAGKRTPIMPYINRSFYENEFNRRCKNAFIEACLRCGYNIFDVKPEIQDISITTRVRRTNSARPTLVVTYAYNAFGDGTTFNNSNGFEVYYSRLNQFASQSQNLSQDIYQQMVNNVSNNGRGVGTLNVSMLTAVNCPATLIEAGFMTNFEEAKLMLNPIYITQVAESTCQGVCQYLDVQYIPREDFSAYPTLRRGNQCNKIILLQYLLNRYGYNLTPDGIFGTRTYNAVTDFQRKNGLTVDGIVGRNTWNALLNPQGKTIRLGDRSGGTWYLQQMILSKLYPIGEIDGAFGQNTLQAVRDFQSENGLTVDGIVGPATWRALDTIGGGRPLI